MAETTPRYIPSNCRFMVGQSLRGWAAIGSASTAWYANNQAVYIPLSLPWSYTVRRVFCFNGATASGNIDLGIYQRDGTKLYSSGSTAQAGTSQLQLVTLGSPLTLAAGQYFIGLALSSTVGTIHMFAAMDTKFGRASGLYQQATALPLPTTPTFAQWASTGCPIVGVTRVATGF